MIFSTTQLVSFGDQHCKIVCHSVFLFLGARKWRVKDVLGIKKRNG